MFPGQPAVLLGPEGELARSLPARVADDHARRAALAGGAAGAGHDRVPRRTHRPARRLRHRRRRVSALTRTHTHTCRRTQTRSRAAGGARRWRCRRRLAETLSLSLSHTNTHTRLTNILHPKT